MFKYLSTSSRISWLFRLAAVRMRMEQSFRQVESTMRRSLDDAESKLRVQPWSEPRPRATHYAAPKAIHPDRPVQHHGGVRLYDRHESHDVHAESAGAYQLRY